jgi:mRNA interferase MazF
VNGAAHILALPIINDAGQWVEFDPSVGSEVHKTRPVVIVSNDTANKFFSHVVVVPLTSNVSKVYCGEAIVTVRP